MLIATHGAIPLKTSHKCTPSHFFSLVIIDELASSCKYVELGSERIGIIVELRSRSCLVKKGKLLMQKRCSGGVDCTRTGTGVDGIDFTSLLNILSYKAEICLMGRVK